MGRAGDGGLFQHFFGQHVFGQGQHDRARAARHGGMKGVTDVFGYAGRIFDLGDPFGHLAEHAAVVDFLKGFALDLMAGDLADEQNHRRGILKGDMNPGRGIGRPWAAGHETDAGPAGHLAVGFGHDGGPAFLAADHQIDFGRVDHGVEHGKIAFSRHAECAVDTVGAKRFDQEPCPCLTLWHVRIP